MLGAVHAVSDVPAPQEAISMAVLVAIAPLRLFPTVGMVWPCVAGSNFPLPQLRRSALKEASELQVNSPEPVGRSTLPNMLSVTAPGPSFGNRLRRFASSKRGGVDAPEQVVLLTVVPPAQGLKPGLPSVPLERCPVKIVLLKKSFVWAKTP